LPTPVDRRFWQKAVKGQRKDFDLPEGIEMREFNFECARTVPHWIVALINSGQFFLLTTMFDDVPRLEKTIQILIHSFHRVLMTESD
jgi:hypothetical protein